MKNYYLKNPNKNSFFLKKVDPEEVHKLQITNCGTY